MHIVALSSKRTTNLSLNNKYGIGHFSLKKKGIKEILGNETGRKYSQQDFEKIAENEKKGFIYFVKCLQIQTYRAIVVYLRTRFPKCAIKDRR